MGKPALLEHIELPFFYEDEAAGILGIDPKSLQVRRSRGVKHPPFVKLGRQPVYPKDEFWKWFDRQPRRKEIASR